MAEAWRGPAGARLGRQRGRGVYGVFWGWWRRPGAVATVVPAHGRASGRSWGRCTTGWHDPGGRCTTGCRSSPEGGARDCARGGSRGVRAEAPARLRRRAGGGGAGDTAGMAVPRARGRQDAWGTAGKGCVGQGRGAEPKRPRAGEARGRDSVGAADRGLTCEAGQGFTGAADRRLAGGTGQSYAGAADRGLPGAAHQGFTGAADRGFANGAGQGSAGATNQELAGRTSQRYPDTPNRGLACGAGQGYARAADQGLPGAAHQVFAHAAAQGVSSGPSNA